MAFPLTRLRRLRSVNRLRDLACETELSVNDLVFPLFIRAEGDTAAIQSMPGHFQLSLADLGEEIEEIAELAIPAVMLFGIPSYKDAEGSSAWQPQGVIQEAIGVIKNIAPELLVMTDLCFCEYTDHGHCGVVNERSGMADVDNDATLELLIKQALSQAEAGSDVIVPSGMMDGVAQTLRRGLDQAGYDYLPILSHTAKYASAFYGPFREAAQGAPQFGTRQSYQMDPRNGGEALREAALDLEEGTDMLLVKPAGYYLDIIYRLRQAYPGVPIGAYQVSGEYSMMKAAIENGWLNEQQVILESLIAIKRAGANFIVTYFAKEAAGWLRR